MLKVLGEVLGEVAPLWVVAGEEDGLIAKDVLVVVEIGVHLFFYVMEWRVELIKLGAPCPTQFLVHH